MDDYGVYQASGLLPLAIGSQRQIDLGLCAVFHFAKKNRSISRFRISLDKPIPMPTM
jgi:hypothetical protein